MIEAAVLALALLIDRVIGEPPNPLHPVVWIGTTVRGLQRLAPERGALLQWTWGACVALCVPAFVAWLCHLLLESLSSRPLACFVASAVLLKTALSLDGLRKAATTMTVALDTDLEAARYALRNLCSRDPSALSPTELMAATIESLAENTSDSVIAPIFYYALFGVPGALAYRAVNTLDAMIGYHGRYEYQGKCAARIDDALNIIPARLTALLLIVAGGFVGADVRGGFRVMRRDAGNIESPNAGWPMAAMAGLLGVRLEKAGHYALGDAEHGILSTTIDRTWLIVRNASWIGAGLVMLGLGALHVVR